MMIDSGPAVRLNGCGGELKGGGWGRYRELFCFLSFL